MTIVLTIWWEIQKKASFASLVISIGVTSLLQPQRYLELMQPLTLGEASLSPLENIFDPWSCSDDAIWDWHLTVLSEEIAAPEAPVTPQQASETAQRLLPSRPQ